MGQTYKFGRGTWATKEGSTLAYNDENENYKPLPFSFERDSIATRVNKEGLIEVVGRDIPRIDYTDSKDGVLLLENSSTNLITYSEDLNNSVWDDLNATVNSNQGVSPDGTQTADYLTFDNVNNYHILYQTTTFTDNQDYTQSYFFKADSIKIIQIYSAGVGFSSASKYANFDLENGIIGETTFTYTDIKDFGNGWFRCIVSQEATANGTGVIGISGIPSLTSDYRPQFQGDGTSGLYVWGAMLESNSIASSYIPTNGSTVQRAAETANGSGNSEVFGNNGGVLFWNSKAFDNIGNLALTGSNGTNAERFQLYFDTTTSDRIKSNVVTGNVAVAPMQSQVLDVTAFHKCANSFANNNHALWVDGFKVGTDTSGGVPQGVNRLNFDNGTGTSDFHGKTKEIGYYDTALTDLELETLTSYRTWEAMVKELNLNVIYNG